MSESRLTTKNRLLFMWANGNRNGYSGDKLHCVVTHRDTPQIMMDFHVLLNFTILFVFLHFYFLWRKQIANNMNETWCTSPSSSSVESVLWSARHCNHNWCNDKRCFDNSIICQSGFRCAKTKSITNSPSFRFFRISIEIYRFLIVYCSQSQFLLHFKQQSTFFFAFLSLFLSINC